MSEEIDLHNVAETVMWLVRSVRDDSTILRSAETQRPMCRLHDYTEFEMYELAQAVDSEDRF
jgi:hypothetical protein